MEYLILGFFTGLSLILAIGAQNLFVIEQGLKKQHVFLAPVLLQKYFEHQLLELNLIQLKSPIINIPSSSIKLFFYPEQPYQVLEQQIKLQYLLIYLGQRLHIAVLQAHLDQDLLLQLVMQLQPLLNLTLRFG